MHDSPHHVKIGQKSAQVGFTEWALNTAFYFLDIKKMDVLYVLPNMQPDCSRFSSGRFDKALELSSHLRNMFVDTQNVNHKRAGSTNMYINGSNSRSGLMSIPVSLLILDELDEMNLKNVELAEQRLSGQLERYNLKLSTPTAPECGINQYYEKTTQDHFYFPCPSCNRQIELKFPESIVITAKSELDPEVENSYLICHECKNTLPHEGKHDFIGKGKWASNFHGRTDKGYYINQMYAMHLHPSYIAKKYLASLKDHADEQIFFNSIIGRPHIVADAKITDLQISKCIKDYPSIDFNREGFVTMGVDVGSRALHVEVDGWDTGGKVGNDINSYARPQLLLEKTVPNFEDLDRIMDDMKVNFAVVDCMPEYRKAIEFANRWYGQVKLCRYPVGVNGRNITTSSDEEMVVSVNRTSWLDMSLGRFKNGTIDLPRDVSSEYKKQVIAQVRVPGKDKNGNLTVKYVTPGNLADHFGHARNYAEIALPLGLGLGVNSNIV